VLSLLYLASALATLLTLILSRDLQGLAAPTTWGAQLQVLWLATLLFLPPSALLGTITPMLVKVSLASLAETGRVIGRIQAAATLGSIVGVFATGFWLISTLGTRPVIAAVAITLLALAVLSNPFWLWRPGRSRLPVNIAIAAVVAGIATVAFSSSYDSTCERESNYYCIGVFDEGPYKVLALDMLIHGYVDPQNPYLPVYPYERVYRAVVDTKFKRDRPLRGFGIGGGAYTFPRYLERAHKGRTVVAEIDEEVTEVAKKDFQLVDTPAIEIVHRDARPAMRDRPEDERYDVVLGDAFGDIAIPYHLVTREFNDIVSGRLSADGVYLVNVVDGVDYDFLRSYLHTMQLSFRYVDLLAVPGESGGGQRATFVVAASNQPIPRTAVTVPPDQFGSFLGEGKRVTLTDDHVPVDQLLAPVFRQRLHESETPEEEGFVGGG
jgi:predicted membrane-bound spermidine synthase